MEIREAPLDNMSTNNIYNTYMVTVNVSPKKFVNNVHWRNYSRIDQEMLLLKEYKKLDILNVYNRDHRFELTKQGLTHLHFVCSTTESTIESVQEIFHKRFGMPALDPSVCCKYTKTVVSRTHAVAYVTKEDVEVPQECLFSKYYDK